MTNVGGEVYDRTTAVLAGRVDERFSSGVDESRLDPAAVRAAFTANKYSLELLADTRFADPETANDHRKRRRNRRERMEDVLTALTDAGVRYASMKNLRGPKVVMSDVDILVASPSSELVAVRVLAERGYEFYQFRLLAHPRKTMAKPDPGDRAPIDIYPDAIWMRKKVCDGARVVERADEGAFRTPAPEDDLYLIATHSYNHLNVRVADLFHGVCVLDDADRFDWEYLTHTARQFGCADALVVYLRLLDRHLAATDRPRVPPAVFDRLLHATVPRAADRWVSSLDSPLSYPIAVPLWLASLASSLYHVPRLAQQATMYEAYKDLQSHYLATASKLFLGET